MTVSQETMELDLHIYGDGDDSSTWRCMMLQVHEGQCGLCVHFGEHDQAQQHQLVQIRTSQKAPEDLIEECDHPQHAGLNLKVTPISGCDGFEPARPN
jgi:hypothetical protein